MSDQKKKKKIENDRTKIDESRIDFLNMFLKYVHFMAECCQMAQKYLPIIPKNASNKSCLKLTFLQKIQLTSNSNKKMKIKFW